MSQKKHWSASAKFEIVLLTLKGETTLNEICQRFQVAPSLVHLWKKQFLEQGPTIFAKQKSKTVDSATRVLEEKQSKLYEKIGQLTVKRDFLKKVWNKFQEDGDDN